ncbi:MAG TPA: hypothetical protein GXX75_20545 [Clostridiales bacterium]|nr:hypothetical protein [Clostridiales bacterium]
MKKLLTAICVMLFICLVPAAATPAATAAAVFVGAIDYDGLTLQVYYNNNAIVYYSTDKKTWTELEGMYDIATSSCTMDISWLSAKSDQTLYFKGDVVTTIKAVTLPAQNTSFRVTFNAVEEEFTFDNAEEADSFEWRKASDYAWREVDMDETSASYAAFMGTVEKFRVKGASIIIRLPQVKGTGNSNVGRRPSKEYSVKIAARAAAPNIKVNSLKLTVNTTSAMEYYNPVTKLWVECDSTMSLEEIAPKALYAKGGSNVTLKIRKAATASVTYSKTATVTIPGQSAPPSLGGSSADCTYYYLNSKLILQFNSASTANAYQYVIVKAGSSFNEASASWKTVTSSKILTISSSTAPAGATVYIRKKGTDAANGAEVVLSSAVNSFKVAY